MSRSKTIWIVVALIVGVEVLTLLLGTGFFTKDRPLYTEDGPLQTATTPARVISVGGVQVHVAIVAMPAERERGLSGITGLSEDEGMLFVFEQDGTHSFWMKDMLFSIDMLWISEDGRVVFIAPSVTPQTFPHSFTSDSPARYVLEVQAGFAAEHGIEVGSKVVF